MVGGVPTGSQQVAGGGILPGGGLKAQQSGALTTPLANSGNGERVKTPPKDPLDQYYRIRSDDDYEVAYHLDLEAEDLNGLSDRGSSDLRAKLRRADVALNPNFLYTSVGRVNRDVIQPYLQTKGNAMMQGLGNYVDGFQLRLTPDTKTQTMKVGLVNPKLASMVIGSINNAKNNVEGWRDYLTKQIDRAVAAIKNPTGTGFVDDSLSALRTWMSGISDDMIVNKAEELKKYINAMAGAINQRLEASKPGLEDAYAEARLIPGPGGLSVSIDSASWLNPLATATDWATEQLNGIVDQMPPALKEWIQPPGQAVRAAVDAGMRAGGGFSAGVSAQAEANLQGFSRNLIGGALSPLVSQWGMEVVNNGPIESWQIRPIPKQMPGLLKNPIAVGDMNYQITDIEPGPNYACRMGLTAAGALEVRFDDLKVTGDSLVPVGAQPQPLKADQRADKFDLRVFGGIDFDQKVIFDGKPVKVNGVDRTFNRTMNRIEVDKLELDVDESEAAATAQLLRNPNGLNRFEGRVRVEDLSVRIDSQTKKTNSKRADNGEIYPVYETSLVNVDDTKLSFNELKMGFDNGLSLDLETKGGKMATFRVDARKSEEKVYAPLSEAELKAGKKPKLVPAQNYTYVDLPATEIRGGLSLPGGAMRLDSLVTPKTGYLVFNPNQTASGQGQRLLIGSSDVIEDGKPAQPVTLSGQLQWGDQQIGMTGLSTTALEADLTRRSLTARNLSAESLSLPGEISVSQLRAARLVANGDAGFSLESAKTGKVSAGKLRVDSRVDLEAVSFAGNLRREGKQLTIDAESFKASGRISDLQAQQLELSGLATVDLEARTLELRSELVDQKAPKGAKNAKPSQRLDAFQLKAASLSLPETPDRPALRLENLNLSATKPEHYLRLDASSGSFETNAVISEQAPLTLSVGDSLRLDRLSGTGSVSYKPGQGLEARGDYVASGKVKGAAFSQLALGQGQLTIDPQGLVKANAATLALSSPEGLSVKGSQVSLESGPNQPLVLRTQDQARIDYSPTGTGRLGKVEQLVFQGQATLAPDRSSLELGNPGGQLLSIASGSIDGRSLEGVKLDGRLRFESPDLKDAVSSLTASPEPGRDLRLSGKLQGVPFGAESSFKGPVKIDAQGVSWDAPASFELDPGQNQPPFKLRTEGPMRVSLDAQGRYIFSSQQGKISGSFGKAGFENLEISGSMSYDPRTGAISFGGATPDQPLQVKGQLAGKPIEVSGKGSFGLWPEGDGLRLSGEDVRIEGLIDGLRLSSEKGAAGEALLQPDGSLDLSALSFTVKVDDVTLKQERTLLSPVRGADGKLMGYDLSLTGEVQTDKAHLDRLLSKVSAASRPDLAARLESARASLDARVKDFDASSTARYENLTLRLNRSFELEGYRSDVQLRLGNAQVDTGLRSYDKDAQGQLKEKKEVFTLTELRNTLQVEGSADRFAIPSGQLSFGLDQKLREQLEKMLEKQIGQIPGLKNVDLEFGAPKTKGDSLDEAGTVTVNLKIKKGISVPIRLDLSFRLENKALILSVDEVRLKGLIGKAVAKFIKEKAIAIDQIDKGLQALVAKEGLEGAVTRPEDTPDRREIRLDLQPLLKGSDITLTDARMQQGQIQVSYKKD